MKPIGKYIVVKNIEEEIKTSSGLLLSGADSSKLRYKKATVIESGTDVNVINKDDVIYYDTRGSHTMIIKNETYTILKESDVVVVV
jgi:co-chaperonin GroES (HSP10)|tara:strand:- start:7288 stop:7545 length:258 start_codon:yes stop_codon:yes gene_type:complete